MRKPVITHEDRRRRLIEYISDTPFKRAKVIKVKDEKCFLGQHYHTKSDSIFYVLTGKVTFVTQSIRKGARINRGWLFEEECLFVPKEVIHRFTAYPGTILLEVCSEPFDKNDEIKAEISLSED